MAKLVRALSHALEGCGFDPWAAGSIPSLGTHKRQLIDVSLSHRCFSLSLFLSLSSLKISLDEDYKNYRSNNIRKLGSWRPMKKADVCCTTWFSKSTSDQEEKSPTWLYM